MSMQYVGISLRDRNSTTEKESVDARVGVSVPRNWSVRSNGWDRRQQHVPITGEGMQSERVASNKDGR